MHNFPKITFLEKVTYNLLSHDKSTTPSSGFSFKTHISQEIDINDVQGFRILCYGLNVGGGKDSKAEKSFLGSKRDIFHPKHGVEENMRKTISSFMESLV